MAMKILESCIDCGACLEECPNEAIAKGEGLYVVDAERCSECVGAFETPQCVEACPIDDCIIPDPDHRETREELQQRYARLHAA
jgi:ferredoxin